MGKVLASVGCIVLALDLGGCAGKAPIKAVVASFAHRLPDTGTKVIVWSEDQNSHLATSTTQEVISALQARGLTVLERQNITTLLQEQIFSLTHGTEADPVNVGKMMGAEEIIFVRSTYDRVNLRVVSVETGEIVWTAAGWFPGYHIGIGAWELVRTVLNTLWAAPIGQEYQRKIIVP